MNNSVYGVIDYTGKYTDISKTEKGAKRYATKHGYKLIGRRNTNHYYIDTIAAKVGNKWQEYSPIEHIEFIKD